MESRVAKTRVREAGSNGKVAKECQKEEREMRLQTLAVRPGEALTICVRTLNFILHAFLNGKVTSSELGFRKI